MFTCAHIATDPLVHFAGAYLVASQITYPQGICPKSTLQQKNIHYLFRLQEFVLVVKLAAAGRAGSLAQAVPNLGP